MLHLERRDLASSCVTSLLKHAGPCMAVARKRTHGNTKTGTTPYHQNPRMEWLHWQSHGDRGPEARGYLF